MFRVICFLVCVCVLLAWGSIKYSTFLKWHSEGSTLAFLYMQSDASIILLPSIVFNMLLGQSSDQSMDIFFCFSFPFSLCSFFVFLAKESNISNTACCILTLDGSKTILKWVNTSHCLAFGCKIICKGSSHLRKARLCSKLAELLWEICKAFKSCFISN